jgi:putative transposase
MMLDRILVDAMRAHLAQHPGRGFAGMYSAFLRHEPGTRERALRLYTEHLLKTNRAKKGKGAAKVRKHLPRQGARDAMWSMDFMQDALVSGRRYWLLNVTDDFSREAISTLVLTRRSAKAVVEHLESLKAGGRKPAAIRTDNGGEFRSVTYQGWARKRDVVCEFIRPGKPTDNAFIERFNSTVRREVLGRIEFKTMKQVQRALDDWRLTYNYARPHQSLGNLSPLQYQHAHEMLRAG